MNTITVQRAEANAPKMTLTAPNAQMNIGHGSVTWSALRKGYDTSFARTLFKALSSWWRRDIRGVSSPSEIVGHEAYRTIIARGDEMLPYIFDDLASNGGAWYFALRRITKTDPVPKEHYGREPLMRSDWLRWAKENGYLA